MPIRILLVDDHPPIREAVRMIVERTVADIQVVGEAGCGEEARRLIDGLRPDVVLLDCQMPGLEGAEVAAWVQERGLPTRVLALSAYQNDQHVHEMLQAGAAGYVLKDESLETVVEAVEAVARWEAWYSQKVMGRVAAWARGERAAGLTGREAEALPLLAKGYTNACIAQELGITERTAAFHVGNLLSKLNAGSRTEAVVEAIRRGWLRV